MRLILKIINAFFELIIALFKVFILNDESCNEREKIIGRELFEEEADALGLDEWEKKDCKDSGMTPGEWAEENDSNYED